MQYHRYLVSNLRETLSILESLRISRSPGRGLRHLSLRPVLEGPLRATEAALVTGDKDGEFPVLIEIAETRLPGNQLEQARTVPLSAVERVIFRTEADRDRIRNRTFENASPERLVLAVENPCFDESGDARFSRRNEVPTGENRGWHKADWICGGVAAARAAARLHPDTRSPAKIASLETAPGLRLFTSLEASPARKGVMDSLVDLLARESGSGDLYGEELLERSVYVLEKVGVDNSILDAFSKRMNGILSSDITRRPGELSDEGDIALRALSLLIQRPTTDEVIQDRVRGELPGLRVFLTAAMLSGVREGLARLPWAIKKDEVELIGTIGSLIEDDPDTVQLIDNLIGDPEGPQNTGLTRHRDVSADREQSQQSRFAGPLSFEICRLSSKATAGRALIGVADKPPSWRIICDEGETLHLQVLLGPTDDAAEIEAEAREVLRSWRKRVPSKETAKTKGNAPGIAADTLPGLLEQPEK